MLDGSQEQGIVNPTEKPKLSADLEARYQTEKERIAALYRNVWVWHGTGRYDQAKNGPVDLLQGVLSAGLIKPHLDVWDGSEKVETTSATVNRPYATTYSDIHLQEDRSDLLFKDKRKLHLLRQTLPHLPSLLWHSRRLLRQREEAKEWMERHTGQEIQGKVWKNATRFGKLRSKISGDYPILIGFKKDAFEPIKTAGYIQATEVRTDKPITLDKINHMEVPLKYVQETELLLQANGVSIEVLPREFGERYSTEFRTNDLISGKAFK